ncbi:hypothetical protein GCM10009742_74310 [Kribbella karoonensis]|uniref:FXSXX-COOH protein n=1 Tax=Kribbella karoonensis TaxID=324851 RepID=A0ABN2EMX7_9ACTN
MTQVTTRFAVIPRHAPRLTGMTIHRLMSTMATEQVRDLEDLLAVDSNQTTDDRTDAAAEQ